MASPLTQTPFREALPALLKAQKTSLRELGRRLGVDPTFLSRVRRGKQRLPDDLPAQVATAFGLPRDYFPEAREQIILEAIRQQPRLRELVYNTIRDATAPKAK